MIRSKRYKFVSSLVLTCICTASFGAEQNEFETQLKFGTNTRKSQLWISRRSNTPGRGPIKPSHVAVFHIRRPSLDMPIGPDGIQQILNTSTGKSLSERQREFLKVSDALTWWGIDTIRNHDTVLLYAVGEAEAVKTVRAYLEVAKRNVDAKRRECERFLSETKERLSEAEKGLPERRKKAAAAESDYRQVKDDRFSSLSYSEAYEQAKETTLQMDKMLDLLEIELAGIHEKLSAIDAYRHPENLPETIRRKRLPDGMILKLDQMFVEQTIELKSAEARKQAALNIRGRDKAFLDLSKRWNNLRSSVDRSEDDIRRFFADLRRIEKDLTNPSPDMLPPELYQDKVTIYPVLIND